MSKYRPVERKPAQAYLDWFRGHSNMTELQIMAMFRQLDVPVERARLAGVMPDNPFDRLWPERSFRQLAEVMMEAIFKYLEAQGRSWKTTKWYRDRAKVFLRYLEETGHQVRDPIDRDVILAFYAHLRAKGRSPATLAGNDRAFRHFFGYLSAEGLIPVNPMDTVDRLKAPKKLHDPFSRDEITRLLVGIYRHEAPPLRERDVVILRLLYDTGMRSGALCGIRYPEDIDNRAREVRVRTKYDKTPILAYGVRTQQAIEAYLKVRPVCPHLIVRERRGAGPLTNGGVHEALVRWRRNSGVRYRKMHFLRSTAACEWYASGMAPQQIQIALDHEDYSTTRIYTATAENLQVRELMRDNAPGDRISLDAELTEILGQ